MQIGVAYYHLKREKQPGVLHFRLNTQEGVDEFSFFPLNAPGGDYVSSDPERSRDAFDCFLSAASVKAAARRFADRGQIASRSRRLRSHENFKRRPQTPPLL